jgi:uncharacterized protein (TIGR02145 family)
MRSKLFYLVLALVITGAASVNAQVIIGSASEDPHAGAILDLASGRNSNLGLLLPNVQLGNEASAFTLGSNGSSDLTTATGMVVYNTAYVLDGPGIYAWDGNEWDAIICFPAAPEPIVFSTTITKLGETIKVSVPEVTGATTYEWTLPDGLTASSSAHAHEITITASAAGEYPAGSIKVKAVKACGTTTERSNTAPVTVCPTAIQDNQANWYCTAEFGTAGWWMTQNLRSTNNEAVTLVESSAQSTTGKHYHYPDLNTTILEDHPEYGLLYNWAAATNRTEVTADEEKVDNGPHQGICPSGWHVPTALEWGALRSVISADQNELYASFNSTGSDGTKMKSKTEVVDAQSNTNGESHTKDKNGFDGLLVGDANNNRAYNYGLSAYFWTSSSRNGNNAYRLNLYRENNGGSINTDGKTYMFSVRCKENN